MERRFDMLVIDQINNCVSYLTGLFNLYTLPFSMHSYDKDGHKCNICDHLVLKEFSICSCCLFNKMSYFKYNRIYCRDCPFCGLRIGIIGNWIAVLFGTRIHKCDFKIMEVWNRLNN